jgi:multidrug resistance efflux pump
VFLGVLVFSVNLWNRHVAPPSIVGEVEAIRSSITATEPGEIEELNVDLLTRVEKGDPIATISVMEDETVKASINSMMADLTILEERLRQGTFRFQENLEGLRINIWQRKIELANDRAQLVYAEAQLRRAYSNVVSGVTSQADYDLAKANADSLRGKVKELESLIQAMEQNVAKLEKGVSQAGGDEANKAIARAIEAKQAEIKALSAPLVIRAPMSGVVSAVYKRKGERVVRGDVIVLISSMEADRIVAYVRQPLNVKPKVGDTVEVRSRSQGRALAQAKVMKVGTQLEPINPAILPMAVQNGVMEYGLPMLITLPKGLALMPGEIVDISLPAGLR